MKRGTVAVTILALVALNANAVDFVALYGARPEQVKRALGEFSYEGPIAVSKKETEKGTFWLRFNKGGRLNDLSFTFKKAIPATDAEVLVRKEWGLDSVLKVDEKIDSDRHVLWTDMPGKVQTVRLEKNGEGNISAIHLVYRIGWEEE